MPCSYQVFLNPNLRLSPHSDTNLWHFYLLPSVDYDSVSKGIEPCSVVTPRGVEHIVSVDETEYYPQLRRAGLLGTGKRYAHEQQEAAQGYWSKRFSFFHILEFAKNKNDIHNKQTDS